MNILLLPFWWMRSRGPKDLCLEMYEFAFADFFPYLFTFVRSWLMAAACEVCRHWTIVGPMKAKRDIPDYLPAIAICKPTIWWLSNRLCSIRPLVIDGPTQEIFTGRRSWQVKVRAAVAFLKCTKETMCANRDRYCLPIVNNHLECTRSVPPPSTLSNERPLWD